MKILFVISSMHYGGAERVLSVISNALSRRGHEVCIYMTNTTNPSVYHLDENITLYGEPKLTNVKGSVKKTVEIVRRLRKFVFEYIPDIVVPFLIYNSIYSSFALAFTRYPVVVCERNDPNRIDGKNAGKIHFLLRDIAFQLAKGAVFQSEGARAYFPKSVQKKSAVIMNPIDIKVSRNDMKSTRDKKIVTVGRFVEQKNHKLLLSAFKEIASEYPGLTLEIYGDGPNKEDIVNYAHDIKLYDNVVFAGNVSDVAERIKNAAIFALTSDYEGMPNALAEAMALGIPCVSTDCSPGAARMLIKDQVHGLIVPCNDIEALACAFKKLLSDPAYSESLGQNAMYVNELLNVDAIVSQWETYLSSKLTV